MIIRTRDGSHRGESNAPRTLVRIFTVSDFAETRTTATDARDAAVIPTSLINERFFMKVMNTTLPSASTRCPARTAARARTARVSESSPAGTPSRATPRTRTTPPPPRRRRRPRTRSSMFPRRSPSRASRSRAPRRTRRRSSSAPCRHRAPRSRRAATRSGAGAAPNTRGTRRRRARRLFFARFLRLGPKRAPSRSRARSPSEMLRNRISPDEAPEQTTFCPRGPRNRRALILSLIHISEPTRPY